MQIQPALLPAALDRPFRDAAHRGNLGEGEAAEELQVDDLGQARLDLGQLVKSVADHDQRLRVGHAVGVVDAERGDLEQPAAFFGPPPPHVVDDQPAHDPGGIRHEARLIDEHGAFPAGDREVGFVQQRRHTQRPGTLTVQFAPGEPVQLRVQRAEQGIRDHTLIARCHRYLRSHVHHSTPQPVRTAPALDGIENGWEKTTARRRQANKWRNSGGLKGDSTANRRVGGTLGEAEGKHATHFERQPLPSS